jgi:hypothetical protein
MTLEEAVDTAKKKETHFHWIVMFLETMMVLISVFWILA